MHLLFDTQPSFTVYMAYDSTKPLFETQPVCVISLLLCEPGCYLQFL